MADASTLTPGQRVARDQLHRIAARVPPAIRVRDEAFPAEVGGLFRVDVELNCADLPVHERAGFRFAEPEVVSIKVLPDFPYVRPSVEVTNPSFAMLPNVMWGRYLCLYMSDNDWEPDAGMWGFVDRLTTWFLRAAADELTAPALRWHPPSMNTFTRYPGRIIFRADLGPRAEALASLWTAWASLTPVKKDVYEVQRWMRRSDVAGLGAGSTTAVAPFIALPHPIGFRFPQTAGALVEHLVAEELPEANLRHLLATATRLGRPAGKDDDGEMGPVVLIGSPAAAGEAARGRVAHIVAWRVSAGGPTGSRAGATFDAAAPVSWVPVDDQRPAATTRRDHSRPVRWLAGRRVLLLGCGALGAPIAEHCVRAGVRAITLVDNSVVTPGILVRQPYEYLDIGEPKVAALAGRIKRTDPSVEVSEDFDAMAVVLDGWPAVDLVIDATANRTVAVAIERTRQDLDRPPPVLSVFVGHEADRGIATLALPWARGAGVDILRRLAIDAAGDDELTDVLDDFFPDPPRTAFFQPAPGCSDPTFVGSSADLSALAAQLLNAGTMLLAEAEAGADAGAPDAEAVPSRSATVVRLPSLHRPTGTYHRRQWLDDVVHPGTPQVRIDRAAMATIRRIVAAAAQTDVDPYESGGALLGQIDVASGVVWVTEALPSSGDSSRAHVAFDFRQVDPIIAERRRATRGLVGLVGAWHSHPAGDIAPSDRDLATMAGMTNGAKDGGLTQALLMIVTPGPKWPVDRQLQVYLQMFP